MNLTERKLKILHAIISNYIRTAEPVGSRTLSRNFDMAISPATIRNEMSDLEEMGYLTHPHTSAGRVPSDKAYRLYVNSMMEKVEISPEAKRNIKETLRADIDELDKTIRKAAELLSDITNLASFVLTPTRTEDRLKFVNLLPVDERTVVLMIVAESGKISNTALRVSVPYTRETLDILAKSITYNYKGRSITEVLRGDIISAFNTDIEVMSGLAVDIMPNFMRTLSEMLNVNLYTEGLSNIFDIPEYADLDRAKNFVSLLERKDEFLKKLMDREDGTIVTIGGENADDFMNDCSVITATYHVDGQLIGKVGVIGPTRMKYGEVTSIVEYLTQNLNETFGLESGEDEDNGG